jgi:voltage-gated potassium channel Kch
MVILQSINGYLLLGIMFSLIVAVIMFYNPDAFKFPEDMSVVDKNNFNNYLYFSLVTMSTLGYGDIVPKLPYSRTLATFISIGGQLYIAIIIAMLVGKFASKRNE